MCPPAVVLYYLGALLAHARITVTGLERIGWGSVADASWRQRASVFG